MTKARLDKAIMIATIEELNNATEAYDEGTPFMTDEEWDCKYFDLMAMEKQLGYVLPNSPTQKIHFSEKVSELQKKEHNHTMLSLAKTKDISEVKNFLGDKEFLAMCKMDGLTCSLTYENGHLISAETRGNGHIGEDIFHNAMKIKTIPKHIDYKERLIVDGEIICTFEDFKDFQEEYKNPRNFAAGSIRLLDARECSKRQLEFIAWDVIAGVGEHLDSIEERLEFIEDFGFTIVPYMQEKYKGLGENSVECMRMVAAQKAYPIDGLVYKVKSAKERAKMPATSHHLGGAIALKFADEEYETTLNGISWTMGRTGYLTPVAIFAPIDDGDSIIERASMHNVSVMEELLGSPYLSQPIKVIKANQIIPQVVWGNKEGANTSIKLQIPTTCPVCGARTQIVTSASGVKNLYCTNDYCSGKIINRLDHFVGKKGFDIKGLSSATLDKLVAWGWINTLEDLFKLHPFSKEWSNKPGFGKKSVDKILRAIDDARVITLDKFIAALGIPLIGSTISKEICKHFETYEEFKEAINNGYDFTQWNGFGTEMSNALLVFDYSEADIIYDKYLVVSNPHYSTEAQENLDITVVITGKLNNFKNRDELKEKIELAGGKVVGSVSTKTDYLINNDIESTSSKNLKAKELGVPIITEEDFCAKFFN